jgi:DNA-binding response OmpR family regulator
MAKILVVDDEPEILKLTSRILESRGHTVVGARDGQEALDVARRELPSLVILDLNLPRMDGFAVCKTLKSEEPTKKIPVIMLTAAYTNMNDANKGLEVGADEYVIKPFVKEVLLHNVDRLLAAAK